MNWFWNFPQMSDSWARTIRLTIDSHFRDFTRSYGGIIEAMFEPLRLLLIFAEWVMLNTPWMIVIIVLATLSWFASWRKSIVFFTVVVFLVIGYLGMWEDTMRTVSMIFVCTIISLVIGIPVGIWMARSKKALNFFNPILDVMQTLPSFVYLIPVVMLLGIGRVPGLIAVVIYAVPPIIRLTNHGIRMVDAEVLEAADAYGASTIQKLFKVQLPLALPTIMTGINQTIMMALAMVVIASMIGVQGLGQPVLRAINNQYFTVGLFNGMAIVGIAIVFDRITQAFGKRLQKHQEQEHG